MPLSLLGIPVLTEPELLDPPATDHDVAVIEYGGLAGRDGALRLIEVGEDLVIAGLLDHGGCAFVAMANLHGNPHRLGQVFDRNQIRAVYMESLRVEIL